MGSQCRTLTRRASEGDRFTDHQLQDRRVQERSPSLALRVSLGSSRVRRNNPVRHSRRFGQVTGNSGRTIDTLMARTILPPLLEHETPASSWGLDQLALRNCSWFPLRLASRIEADDHATPVAASQ